MNCLSWFKFIFSYKQDGGIYRLKEFYLSYKLANIFRNYSSVKIESSASYLIFKMSADSLMLVTYFAEFLIVAPV